MRMNRIHVAQANTSTADQSGIEIVERKGWAHLGSGRCAGLFSEMTVSKAQVRTDD